MFIYLIILSLIYLSNVSGAPSSKAGSKSGSKSASSESADDSCDYSFGDAAMSNCADAEYILGTVYQNAIAANLVTPEEAFAYSSMFIDPNFGKQIMDGEVLNEGFQAVVSHLLMESKILADKSYSDAANIRYGPNFVGVDYDLRLENVCGDFIENVKATAFFYCHGEFGLVTDVNIIRDRAALQPFLQQTMMCMQKLQAAALAAQAPQTPP
eukprot:79905_1